MVSSTDFTKRIVSASATACPTAVVRACASAPLWSRTCTSGTNEYRKKCTRHRRVPKSHQNNTPNVSPKRTAKRIHVRPEEYPQTCSKRNKAS
eukprot:5317812-Pyramimonas_sp.AAC.1